MLGRLLAARNEGWRENYMDKATRLARLYEECGAYFDGVYAPEKKVYVFGDGNASAKIVMIGEAPGEQETLLGKPFVGKAGKNLDEFLSMTGLKRADLYITNVVKFRPVKISDKGRASNRPPTREEISLFVPFLQRELEIIQPEVIVTLGNVPLKAVVDQKAVIGSCHGQLMGKVFPLYHPASIIYNRALKDVYEEDVIRFADLAKEHGWDK